MNQCLFMELVFVSRCMHMTLGEKYFYTLKWTIFFIQYNGQYFVTL